MDQISETMWRTAEQQLGTPLPAGAGSLAALPGTGVLSLVEIVGRIHRSAGVLVAAVAAEVARRSNPALGAESLAKRSGAKDAVELIAIMTGAFKRETAGAIEVGTMMANTHRAASSDPLGEACRGRAFCVCSTSWRDALSRFVAAGLLSPVGAAAIIRGLGDASREVTGHALAGALRDLLLQFRDRGASTPEQLFTEAKYRRDGLDRTMILDRERRNQTRRSVIIGAEDDGMHRISGYLTPDVAENLRTLCDGIVSAGLRSPKFTDGSAAAEPGPTIPQLWHDALGAALRVAVNSDQKTLPRQGSPVAVIIRATEFAPADQADEPMGVDDFDALEPAAADAADDGVGVLAATGDVVSAAFVRTTACADGIAPITIDPNGAILNLGRTQRLFSAKQRVVLAARDGGCRWRGCDRPASWCDAHHINEWERDGGRTDVADGILLCRTHHLLLHNQHWRIVRKGHRYYLYRTRESVPGRRLTELPTRNPLHRTIPHRQRQAG